MSFSQITRRPAAWVSVILLISLVTTALFSGCGNDETVVPTTQTNAPFGMSLVMPPEGVWEDYLGDAQADTTWGWLYRLGNTEGSAFAVQPNPFDGTPDISPTASDFTTGDDPLELTIDSESSDTWYRVFVKQGLLRGKTTFTLGEDDIERQVYVSLSPATATSNRIVIYQGLAMSSLSAATQMSFAHIADEAPVVIFPVAIENSAPIEGLEMLLGLSNSTSASLLLDPGSRLFASGASDDFTATLTPLTGTSAYDNTYRLLIEPTAGAGSGATIAAGSDVLFYLVIEGTTGDDGICIDSQSARLDLPDGGSVSAEIPSFNTCDEAIELMVAVTSPSSGQSFCGGDEVTISWTLSAGWENAVSIDLLLDGTSCGDPIVSATEGGAVSHTWNAAQCGSSSGPYQIRVTALGDVGYAGSAIGLSETFTISPGCEIAVTSPNGGESYAYDEEIDISWSASSCCDSQVKIDLLQNGSFCLAISAETDNDGSFSWDAETCGGSGDGYTVRVQNLAGTFSDVSDESFTIGSPCSISLTAPAPNAELIANLNYQITWNAEASCGETVKLELINGGTACALIDDDAPNTGSYSWRASRCSGLDTGYSIRITDLDSGVFNIDAGTFSIYDECGIVLNYPVGGEEWTTTVNYSIRWGHTTACGDSVRIDLLNNQTYCKTIANRTINDGMFIWAAEQCSEQIDNYQVRITDLFSGNSDSSAATFSISPYVSPCVLTVTSPSGGEELTNGANTTIEWDAEGACGETVRLDLLRNNEWCRLIKDFAPNTGTYTWNANRCDSYSDNYKIKITDLSSDSTATSAESFEIAAGCRLALLTPNGGESYCAGDVMPITWTASDCGNNLVTLELLQNGEFCGTLITIAASAESYSWTAGLCAGGPNNYSIRIRDNASDAYDTSDSTFDIHHACTLALSAPNGGESYCAGDAVDITWTASTCCGSTVKIELLKNNGPCLTIAESTSLSGSYPWTAVACDEDGGSYTIRVTDLENAGEDNASDTSDATFTVAAGCDLTLTAPVGGEEYNVGEELNITWTASECCTTAVDIDLYNQGEFCLSIADGYTGSGSYPWTVAACAGPVDGYTIQITELKDETTATNSTAFSIVACSISVTYPGEGDNYCAGSDQLIEWDDVGCSDELVTIELRQNGAQPGETLGTANASDGEFEWVPEQIESSSNYSIHITNNDSGETVASEGWFTISDSCALTLTAPVDINSLCLGSSVNITWSAGYCCGDSAKVELLRNDQAVAVLASAVADTSLSWSVESYGGEDGYKFRITDLSTLATTESASSFSIESGSITLTSPLSGVYAIGETIDILWDAPCASTMQIELWNDNAVNNPCSYIATGTANDGSYEWTAAQCLGLTYNYYIVLRDPVLGTSQVVEERFRIGPITINVLSDGSGDYPTIQAAIDAAGEGDTISLSNGTYTGSGNFNLDFGGKAIIVKSASGDPMSCLINVFGNGETPRRAFIFHRGETTSSVVQDIGIRNGYALQNGGAIYCDGASPLITGCAIDNSQANGEGGGAIACRNASPTIQYCTLAFNLSLEGTDIYCESNSSPLIRNCILYSGDGSSNWFTTGGSVPTWECCVQYPNDDLPEGSLIYNLDPEFCEEATGDYNVTDTSFCSPENNETCGKIGAGVVACEGSH